MTDILLTTVELIDGVEVEGSAVSISTTDGQGPVGPTGPTGATGPAGATGPQGDPGQGVPVGGTAGQVLAKATATDYDTEWTDAAAGGGAVDSVNGQTGVVVLDATDVGADASGTAAAAVTAHEGDVTDAHTIAGVTGLQAALDGKADDADITALDGRVDALEAVDNATQAELDAHAADTTLVHGIADTTALETTAGAQAKVDAHVNDVTAAHAASAVAFTPAGSIAATDVQAALAELDSEKSATGHTHTLAAVTDAGDSAALDVGTTAGTVAAGDHAHAGGGGETVTASKTTTYTAAASEFVRCDSSGGAFTVTSPAHSSGAYFTVKMTDSSFNAVTISPASGTIDGLASYKLYVQGAAVTLISDGTNWQVSREVSSQWVAYTPSFTGATTNPVLGTGGAAELAGRVQQSGKTARVAFIVRWGTSGTSFGSGQYSVSLPVAARSTTMTGLTAINVEGMMVCQDDSAGVFRVCSIQLGSTTTLIFIADSATANVSPSNPFTFANNDSLRASISYELAMT